MSATTLDTAGPSRMRLGLRAVMIAAVVISIGVMLFAAGPISDFIHKHPTTKMLALSFLLMIGFSLVAEGFGFHIPKGYLYAAIGFVLAIWFGVDSVYKPRRAASPLLDRVIVATGLVVWFTPALAALVVVGQALASGRIHFVRPPRDYFLATDPIAFWQGVGFWLIMGGLFAFLAWRYWRARLFPRSATTD